MKEFATSGFSINICANQPAELIFLIIRYAGNAQAFFHLISFNPTMQRSQVPCDLFFKEGCSTMILLVYWYGVGALFS
jgi:hypothetical protein